MNADILRFIAAGAWMTVIVTVCSFVVGAVLGVPLALARGARHAFWRWLGAVYVELVRAVPPVVWLFLVFFGLPQTGIELRASHAAIFTFGVVASSYLGEIFRSGIGALARGQFEAAAALGLSRLDAGRYIIGPQVLRVIIPALATYAIGLLKDSALASTIGVGELVFRTNTEVQRAGNGLSLYLFTGAIYLALSLPVAVGSRRLDHRLRDRYSPA